MLHVSDEYAQEILSDSRDMPYRVSINGVMLDQSDVPNMQLSESVSSSNGLSLGTANAAELTLTLDNPMLSNYDGMLVEPESGLVLPDGSTEWVPLGKFWVTKTSTSNNYKTVKLTCVDGMYQLSGEYSTKLKYPADIRAVVNEIVSQAAIEFVEPETWPDLVVRVKPEKMTLRNAIGYAAGCCGCNARFNREGKLEFVWYTDTGVTVEPEQQYMDGLTKLYDKPLKVSFEVVGEQEKYDVIIVSDENGSVYANPSKNVLEGDRVSLSVNPATDYMLATISAEDANGNPVSLISGSKGTGYTFIQPDCDVTVTASFKFNTDGPFFVSVRSPEHGYASHSESTNEEGPDYFLSGEKVELYVWPEDGYTVDTFTTTPANLGIVESGTVESETMGTGIKYVFTMPESDASVTVRYRQAATYTVTCTTDPSAPGGYGYVSNLTTGEKVYHKGDTVLVKFLASGGYVFDCYEASVSMIQTGVGTYKFIMPGENVTIKAFFKFEEDETKTDLYSWLQEPQAPPASKPYWAVLYKYDPFVPVCQRFHLVWFDSWTITGAGDSYDKPYYTIQFNGYYSCGSKNTGHYPQAWDTSTWSGNGAAGSTLSWDTHLGFQYGGYYAFSGNYCLLASNVPLYRNNNLMFKACPNAIRYTGDGYVIDGMDVRERGVLTYYKCPDTFSTPAPGKYWMVLDCDNYISMTYNEKEFYEPTDAADGLYALFFDSIAIENIGAAFNNMDEQFYVATVTNGKYAVIPSENASSWGTLHDITAGAVVGLRNPLNGQSAVTGVLGGKCFSGVLSTNVNLWSGGDLFMYKNSCEICDCAPTVRLKARRAAAVVTEPVTLTYTNPMIYEKMVPAISAVVQGLTYTPARVKHRGNPAFQAGDIISCTDKDGTSHTILIQQQTMSFGGGMNSEVSSPGQSSGTANFSAASPVTTQIKEAVNKSCSDLERDMSVSTSAAFSAIYQALGNTQARLNEQVNSMEDLVYNITNTIAGIESRLSIAEGGFTGVDDRFTEVEKSITYLQNDLTDVQKITRELEEVVSVTEADIKTINEKLAELSDAVDKLSTDTDRITALETGLTAVESDVSSLKTKVRDVQTGLANETTAREEAIAAIRQVPDGGEDGQVLTQTAAGTPEWKSITEKKTASLNFSQWDNGQFFETVDGDETEHVYTVEFDAQGRPVKITDAGGHEMSITW